MKKLTLCLSLLALLGAASCKKDEKKDNSKSSANFWTVSSITYNSASGACDDSSMYYSFADSMKYNMINIAFNTPLTASGTFKINPDIHGDVKDARIVVFTGNLVGHAASGDLSVTVDGSKVSFKCTGLVFKSYDDKGNPVDDRILSANLTYTKE